MQCIVVSKIKISVYFKFRLASPSLRFLTAFGRTVGYVFVCGILFAIPDFQPHKHSVDFQKYL